MGRKTWTDADLRRVEQGLATRRKGVGAEQFLESQGVPSSTFYTWRKRRRGGYKVPRQLELEMGRKDRHDMGKKKAKSKRSRMHRNDQEMAQVWRAINVQGLAPGVAFKRFGMPESTFYTWKRGQERAGVDIARTFFGPAAPPVPNPIIADRPPGRVPAVIATSVEDALTQVIVARVNHAVDQAIDRRIRDLTQATSKFNDDQEEQVRMIVRRMFGEA